MVDPIFKMQGYPALLLMTLACAFVAIFYTNLVQAIKGSASDGNTMSCFGIEPRITVGAPARLVMVQKQAFRHLEKRPSNLYRTGQSMVGIHCLLYTGGCRL